MATGDIGEVGDTLKFEDVNAMYPSIVRVADDMCAIAYNGELNDGWLQTVEITGVGEGGVTAKASKEFDEVNCWNCKIVHITGDIFAVAYRGVDDDGWLQTVEITSAGGISLEGMASKEFDALNCDLPDIAHCAGDVYAICYEGNLAHPHINTVTINAAGGITCDAEDAEEIKDVTASENKILKIGETDKYVTLQARANEVWLQTVQIYDSGEIADVEVHELKIDDTDGTGPDLVHVTGNLFAVSYPGPGGDGFLKTVTVSDAGIISVAGMDTMEFDEADCDGSAMAAVSANVYAICYLTTYSYCWLKTVTINDDGSIDDTKIDEQQITAAATRTPKIVFLSGDIYAIAHRDDYIKGFVSAVDIETPEPPPPGAQHLMMMGVG